MSNSPRTNGEPRETILVVEDSRTQAEQLRYILEQAGFQVTVASNGEAALETISEQMPSLVVTDINMPGMDGYELCRRIKHEPDHDRIPVMLLTTLADPMNVIRGLQCGADNFMVKPYKKKVLLARVTQMLANSALRDSHSEGIAIAVTFSGQQMHINSGRLQILNLLLSTYETAVQQNEELAHAQKELQETNERLEALVEHRTAQLREEVQERKKREAWFRAVLETAPDAIIIANQTGEIVEVNKMTETMFGYKREELLGQPVELLIPDASGARHAKNRKQYLTAPDTRLMATHGVGGKRKDQSEFPIEIGMSPLDTEDGTYVIAVVRDITERRLLEQQLQQSQKMEAIGQLTGGIAHDFNNLLGVVLGNLDLLEHIIGKNEQALQRVETAQKAAMRGADLTKRLLAFSRRQHLEPHPTLVNHAIENMVEMATRILGPDIEVSVELEEVPPVYVDPAGLENALLNLAINSRDAMPKGGEILLTSKVVDLDEYYPAVVAGEIPAGPYACVSVSDTGIGMTRATMEKALEPFFTTKGRGKGTGLGLSMIYGFVKQSGGHLNLYSEVGHGTRITLYLPFAEEGDVSVTSERKRLPLIQGGKTVLVVDDEVDLLEVAVAFLLEMNFRVFHATDGPSALEIARREPDIDVLLTDVVMPGGMTGTELSHKMTELIPGIKVIYSTGFSSKALNVHSSLNLDGIVLTKPYRRQEFMAAIYNAFSVEVHEPDNGNEHPN